MSRARTARKPRPRGSPSIPGSFRPMLSPPAFSPRRSAANSAIVTAKRNSMKAVFRFAAHLIRKCNCWQGAPWSTALSATTRRMVFAMPMRHIDIGQDLGIPLADVPALGDVAPWRLAVVLDATDAGARIGLQPHREKSGEIERERESGTLATAGLHWNRGTGSRASLGPGDVIYVGADRGKTSAVPAAANPGSQRRDRRDGPLHRPRVRHGGRFFLRPVRVQSRDAGHAPPGSSFKPFVYATALDNGYTPSSIILDEPIEIDRGPGLGVWRPENFEGKSSGPHTLRYGVEHSINQMTVRLARDVGMPLIAEYAKRFGIYDDLPPYLAMSLGSGETTLVRLTTAYSMFANGGKKIKETLIDRIQDRWGHTIYRHDERTCEGCDAPAWRNQEEPRTHRQTGASARSPHRLSDHLDHGRSHPARHRPKDQGSRQAPRRQNWDNQRRQGSLVHRLFARSRGRRIHGLRSAALARGFGASRALYCSDLSRLHEDGPRRQT